MTRAEEVELSIRKKFHKQLFSAFAKAINAYELLAPGDRVAVCISGGKDSMLAAKLFQELKRHNKFEFELKFICMDPGYRRENRELIESNAALLEIPLRIFESPIFEAVTEVDQSPCYLCARMRRGYLYKQAQDLGCNKIALGHHYDDVIETILMGMLYGGQVQTMMPKLHSTNFPGMELIRPMYLIREADILLPDMADMRQWSVIACDQFSSDPDYWARVKETAAGAPSTLDMVVPEALLGTIDKEKAAGTDTPDGPDPERMIS